MRISDNQTYDQVKTQVSKNRDEMAQLQNMAATQKRVTKPSDDPMASARVMATKTDMQANEQYVKNLQYAKSFLEYSDQSMSELSEVFMRLKELSISQASDASAGPETRRMVASEVEQLYDQVVRIGNRRLGDRFLFGGFQTTASPFKKSGDYSGDNGEMLIQVNAGDFVPMNLPGSKIFLGKGLSAKGTNIEFDQNADPRVPLTKPEPMIESSASELRGPASEDQGASVKNSESMVESNKEGLNLFQVVDDLVVGLKSNDKRTIQQSVDRVDDALNQVIFARSLLGARTMALNNTLETLQKGKVEANILKTTLEDVDTFNLVSDINKSENGLRATLASSGKLIQPSLIDFLR